MGLEQEMVATFESSCKILQHPFQLFQEMIVAVWLKKIICTPEEVCKEVCKIYVSDEVQLPVII